MSYFSFSVFGGVAMDSTPVFVATHTDELRSSSSVPRLTAVTRSCPAGAFAVTAVHAGGGAGVAPDGAALAGRQLVVACQVGASGDAHRILLDPTLPIGPQLDALAPLQPAWHPVSVVVSLTPTPAPSDPTTGAGPPSADVMAVPATEALPVVAASFQHAVKQALFACLGPAALTRMVDAGDGSWQEAVLRGARTGDSAAAAAGWERLLHAGDEIKGVPVRFLGAPTMPAAPPGGAAGEPACVWMHQLVLPPAAPLEALVAALETRGLLREAPASAETVLVLGASAVACTRVPADSAAAVRWSCAMSPAKGRGSGGDGAPSAVDVSAVTLGELHRTLAQPDGFLYASCPPAS
jgi:hypothetical protein